MGFHLLKPQSRALGLAGISWDPPSHAVLGMPSCFLKWGMGPHAVPGRGCRGKRVESPRHVGTLLPSRKINIAVIVTSPRAPARVGRHFSP